MKAKEQPDSKPFQQVDLATLRQSRRGKHHETVSKVIKELKSAPDGAALKIPLSQIKGLSATDFRSAISRGAVSEGLKISTYSDSENFYVWLRSAKTKDYERKRSRGNAAGSK